MSGGPRRSSSSARGILRQATIPVSVHTNSSSDSTLNGSCDATLNVMSSDSHTAFKALT